MAGSAFDAKVKNYVFTHNPPQSAAPAGVEFVNQPIKAFAARLREKKGKTSG
jgi:deoxyribodipyrimidine photolyase